MSSHIFSEFDARLDAKIRQWSERNPHAVTLPPYLDALLEKSERKESHPDLSKLDFGSIYKLEAEIDSLFLAKSDRHRIRQELADYIDKGISGFPYADRTLVDLPEKLRRARTSGSVGITDQGRHLTAWDEKVNCKRICPDESREECQRLAREYRPEIMRLLKNHPGWELHFVILTTPNVPESELLNEKRSQYKKLYKLTRRAWGKENIKGVFAIQEDPLSKDHEWNVHINAIMITAPKFNYKRLRAEWGGNMEARWIKGTHEDIARAFLEAVKYAAKHIGEKSEDGKHTIAPGMTAWPYRHFVEWFKAGRGFRRSRSYGVLNGFERKPEDAVRLEDVQWIGVVKHDGTAYQVHLKNEFRGKEVDLIQAHKFANQNPESLPDPFHRRASGQNNQIGLSQC